MVKYFISFVLLALLALENNHIYNRVQARSQPPDGETLQTIAHYMRPHQQQHHHLHQTQLPYHLHKQSRRAKHNRPRAAKAPHPPQQQQQWHEDAPRDEAAAEEEAAAALRHYIHLQRHMVHQREHLREQQQQYHHSGDGAVEDSAVEQQQELEQQQQQQLTQLPQGITSTAEPHNLRNVPRLWQHLSSNGDRMYGDAPSDYSEESQSLEALLPPMVLDDEHLASSNSLFDSAEDSSAAASQNPQPKAPMRCPKCESSRRVEHISEEELTRLRIEFVKQQILEKLRLKERPNVSAVGLPKPIYEGTTIEEEDEHAKNKDLDDYYARTSKKFIFLQREKRECQRLGMHPSMCFSFKIDDADADGFDVNTAVLWIFKSKSKGTLKRNDTLLNQQTIVVSEVQQNEDAQYLPIVKTIAIQSVDVQDEWMKIDIEWPIKRWFGNHDLSHLIRISCESCDIQSMEEMISVDKDYRPFIMVDTQNRRRVSRQKRGINCTGGVTECCREKLYISFDEIGWGDWIIQPRGYDAYFCRGSCGSVASVTQSATHHSTFLQKMVSSRRSVGQKPLELIPCCTAKQYSSLQLVFMDSNNTATQKTFPNMVVESCGCR